MNELEAPPPLAEFLSAYRPLVDTHAVNFLLPPDHTGHVSAEGGASGQESLCAADELLDALSVIAWCLATTNKHENRNNEKIHVVETHEYDHQYQLCIAAERWLRDLTIWLLPPSQLLSSTTSLANSNTNTSSIDLRDTSPTSSIGASPRTKILVALTAKVEAALSALSSSQSASFEASLATLRCFRQHLQSLSESIQQRLTTDMTSPSWRRQQQQQLLSYPSTTTGTTTTTSDSAFPPLPPPLIFATRDKQLLRMNPKKVYEVARLAPFIHACIRQQDRRIKSGQTVSFEKTALEAKAGAGAGEGTRRTITSDYERAILEACHLNVRAASGEKMTTKDEAVTIRHRWAVVDIGAGQGYLSAVLCMLQNNTNNNNNNSDIPPHNHNHLRAAYDNHGMDGEEEDGDDEENDNVKGEKEESNSKSKNNKQHEEQEEVANPLVLDVVAVEREGGNCHGSLRNSAAVQYVNTSTTSITTSTQQHTCRRRSHLHVVQQEIHDQTSVEDLCTAIMDALYPAKTTTGLATASSLPHSTEEGKFAPRPVGVSTDDDVPPTTTTVVEAVHLAFVSLHACGALSHNMLRLFADMNQSQGNNNERAESTETNEMNNEGLATVGHKRARSIEDESSSRPGGEGTSRHLLRLPRLWPMRRRRGSSSSPSDPSDNSRTLVVMDAPLLVNVGCCYNLIPDNDDGPEEAEHVASPPTAADSSSYPPPTCMRSANVFPLSKTMACDVGPQCPHQLSEGTSIRAPLLFLSRNMKMAACQAPQRWLSWDGEESSCVVQGNGQSGRKQRKKHAKKGSAGGTEKEGGEEVVKEVDSRGEKEISPQVVVEGEEDIALASLLNVFEGNYQRAVLQNILFDAYCIDHPDRRGGGSGGGGGFHNGAAFEAAAAQAAVRFFIPKGTATASSAHAIAGQGSQGAGQQGTKRANENETNRQFAALRRACEKKERPQEQTANKSEANNAMLQNDNSFMEVLEDVFVSAYAAPSTASFFNQQHPQKHSPHPSVVANTERDTLVSITSTSSLQSSYLSGISTAIFARSSPAGNPSPPPPPRVRLSALWALRAVIGSAVLEPMIALDRVLYLKESLSTQGRGLPQSSVPTVAVECDSTSQCRLKKENGGIADYHVASLRVFHPVESPRSNAIVAAHCL